MMRRMILCLACAAASPFVCVVITGFNAVETPVWKSKFYGAFTPRLAAPTSTRLL